jgi:hypothetical protein
VASNKDYQKIKAIKRKHQEGQILKENTSHQTFMSIIKANRYDADLDNKLSDAYMVDQVEI